MSIKDFKVESGIVIDNVKIDLSSNVSSGGVVFSSSSGSYVSSDGNIPVGVVRMWASGSTSPTVPDDYLICDGRQDLSQTTYARLYAVIGNRFTVSPNGSTFGLPSFNSSGKSYPVVLGIDDANDVANAGVFLQTATTNTAATGANATTSHEHTAGNSFVANSTTSSNLAHAHNGLSATDNHNHSFDQVNATSGGGHTHNTSNANLAHAHNYLSGSGNFVESSGINANHTHGTSQATTNHAHNSNSGSHTHGSNVPSTNSRHSHSFQATLAAQSVSHSHSINTSGFYFIIRFQ
jgi:hypothetical protein